MSPRRPPRPWIGPMRPPDPGELAGPRGLTEEVLGEQPDDAQGDLPPQFCWELLTPARRARIEEVVASRLRSVTVVLDRLLDPHNAAAILRTAEGLGLSRVHLVPHDAADRVAHRRVTRDAHRWLEIASHPSGAEAAAALRAEGFEVWAGNLEAEALHFSELPSDRPLALLFGNEHEGPAPETLRACAGAFRIPMAGFTRSLNVSVAAAIALQRAVERRRAHLGAAGDLSAPERAVLRDRFSLLAARIARRMKHRQGDPVQGP